MEQGYITESEAHFPPDAADEVSLNIFGRLREAVRDEEIRGAALAVGRTVLNAAITAIDFIPGVGEGASWAADAGKFTKRFNLTPDVSRFVAIGTEPLEFASVGVTPTHAVESVLQLKHDARRIKAGWQRWQELKG